MSEVKNNILLVVDAELLSNWIELVPPPKFGNTKDPDKIAAKQAEWEKGASAAALVNPAASITGDWLFEVQGANSTPKPIGGTGFKSMVDEISIFCVNEDGMPAYRVIAFDAKTILKRLSLECLAAKMVPPSPFWYYPFGAVNEVVLDPVKMLCSGCRDDISVDILCHRLGVSKPEELSLEHRLDSLKYMARCCGLGVK